MACVVCCLAQVATMIAAVVGVVEVCYMVVHDIHSSAWQQQYSATVPQQFNCSGMDWKSKQHRYA